jgi:predicted permease
VGGREIGALLLLTIGSFVIPVIGWAAGIVLLWTSEAWNRRDKIIGTLLTPGGAVLIIVVVAVASSAGASGGPGHLALLLLLVMPIATAVYLLVQLNRRAPPM